ncbi:hypothetical protein CRYUN_Cryun01aG0179600 [Craigia yunnanensis]
MSVPLFNLAPNLIVSRLWYPVTQHADTQGKSEEYFGQWVRKRKIFPDRLVVTTKVAGPSGQMSWIKDGPKCLDARNISEAADSSLKRLQMDYIDLYQIHWPDQFRNNLMLLAEQLMLVRINLLGYSPLAMGILSGKYFASDGSPPDAWLNLFRGRIHKVNPDTTDQKHI